MNFASTYPATQPAAINGFKEVKGAAINAARKGAKVAIVDKGPVIRSGSGGAGVDHWHGAVSNPCCKLTMDDMIDFFNAHPGNFTGEYGNGITFYILCKESYDVLLDLEQMGIRIRDEEDEFAGAEFRDDKTKFMFAYDYENRLVIRVPQGAIIKPALHKELKRLGVEIFDRVMVTSLLTEGGKQDSRVVGATGLNTRTGEFYIFKAKASILSMAMPKGIWVFSTELAGGNVSHDDPNCVGDGHAIAWNAGAEFTMMEASMPSTGTFKYPPYGVGNAQNTWYACTIVDANGKEIPWIDKNGKILKTVSERYRPPAGQKLQLFNPPPGTPPEYAGPRLIPDLPERIRKGEFVLPLYADLPGMPEHERRAIFGLMVGNEGKTRIPIYETYTQAGFDPDKDLLQTNIMPPERYAMVGGWSGGIGPPQWRETLFVSGGGIVFDWNLRTSLEGLYAAGNQLANGGDHASAACTGRYAARKAAEYASRAKEVFPDRDQIDREKARVYAPVKRENGIEWKELQAGICRIMQDYCGDPKSEETLKMGLTWLDSIRESEGSRVSARNPHELARTLECFSRLTVGEMIIHASLARKASSTILGFNRLDYPEKDLPEWDKFITARLKNGEVHIGELSFNYWILPPYAPTYEENYERHCGL